MSLDTVREHLKRFQLEDKILTFEKSSATVELAAEAVGCEPARIAKTMSFLLPEDKVILVLLAGDTKIDNKKYKNTFQARAKMIPFDLVEEKTGHAPGGVCPFAIRPDIEVYLDDSLKRFGVVYPAAGSDNSAVEVTLEELERCSGAKGWVDVGKMKSL